MTSASSARTDVTRPPQVRQKLHPPLQLQNDRDNPLVITEVRHVIVDSREQALALERTLEDA